MEFLHKTTWNQVFLDWKLREGSNPGWINCATKIKGWPDWESWRGFSMSLVRAGKRDWSIYKLTDPMEEIPNMLVGPYTAWQKNLPNQNVLSFADFLDVPEKFLQFNNHDGVAKIAGGLPFATQFIGLLRDDNQKIVCLEGNHRAVAIALAKRRARKIDFSDTEVTIALAHLPGEETHLLSAMLRRGSAKEP